MCVPWELNPQPFVLLTQCSTTEPQEHEVLKVNAYLDSRGQTTKNQVKNLGVILETDLSFSSHVKAVTKSAYYHLKNIASIRCFVSSQDL